MSLRDFWAKNDKGSSNPLLPEAFRNLLIDTGSVVIVHAVREGNSKHGLTWFADVEIDLSLFPGQTTALWATAQGYCGEGGQVNEPRRKLMEAMREQIAAMGPIPATLVQFQAKNGNYGWDFGPPPAWYFGHLEGGGAMLALTPGGDDGAPF